MARNEEKAQSMLNRFITLKAEEKKKPKERRPYLASECRDLAEADRWRQQIMREIGRKVAEIQNEGLGEHRLRDLNDEINKLIREKSHWERRIVELGGPNYAKHSAKMTDLEGNIIDVPNPSGRGPGYRYFGAAKKLPGVRELFEKPPELRKRRTRYDIYKRIDASYYGYRDEEDGILEKVEGPAEEEMRMRAVEEWKRMEAIRKEARKGAKEVVSVGAGVGAEVLFEEEEDVVEEERREEREREDIERKEKEREFVVHVPLPDDKEIERMVLEKKKMELLSKYASDSLMEEQTEAKRSSCFLAKRASVSVSQGYIVRYSRRCSVGYLAAVCCCPNVPLFPVLGTWLQVAEFNAIDESELHYCVLDDFLAVFIRA
ncbi:hypothetical protein POTOM_054834 [Populus tomentosa]|uniref:Uncharacterized protein n=1 Tax=Populus tomentosa TaxID=118781 RepID=A0A8X7Y140_POPTO|nr:hypothetical protein POTOM_054834 [Populus tomentosa]